MLAVAVMNVLRQKGLHETDLAQPAEVLRKLNAMFQMETRSSMFFTFWYGVYRLSDAPELRLGDTYGLSSAARKRD